MYFPAHKVQNMVRYKDTRYFATFEGEVINGDTGRQLSKTKDAGGYFCVNLYDPAKHTVRVHKIIAECFLGESDLVVNHIDGDKTNNDITNLEYITPSENTQHAYDIGLKPKGSAVSWAKLNEDIVAEIKLMFVNKVSSTAIAKQFGVSVGTISNIRSGRAWRSVRADLTWDIPQRQKSNRKLIASDIPVIRNMFKQGISDTDISKIYKVNRGTIFNIRSGKNWTNY